MLGEPNCFKRRCIHLIGVRNDTDEECNERVVCTAFPEGIPYEIAYGDNLHREPFPGDNGIQYEADADQRRKDLADDRLTTLDPPCFYCVHITDIGTQTSLVGWTCPAYPAGIPKEILTRDLPHTKVISTQQGTLTYESKEMDYGDPTLSIISFEGKWSNVKS